MAKHLTYEDTKKQSLGVFGQFGEKIWIPNAKENSKLEHKNAHDLQNSGLGKTLVIAAMGESLEVHADLIKKHRDKFDLMCCDKAFVPLMDIGIQPDYVMICDANIPARFYETHVHKTKNIKLIATPYANTLWTKPWLGERYFYINKDAIRTEEIFRPIMGEYIRIIPASSNVSNAMVVFMLGADERQTINWGGYERYYLVGYDYSWRPGGSYYAWNNPTPKRYYMNHATMIDFNGDTVFTSQNLMFSVRWLTDYLNYHNLPVVNCSERGLLQNRFRDKFENQLNKISTDNQVVSRIEDAYKILQTTSIAQSQAKKMFERAREGVLCQ